MELYGIIHQHYNMNPCEKKEIKKEREIEKKNIKSIVKHFPR